MITDLTEEERGFLSFVLSVAFDVMCSGDGFTDEDWAAHEKLKKIADGEPRAHDH